MLNCTAVNCKRLADHAQQAQTGVAAVPQTAQAQLPPDANTAAPEPTVAADPSRWLAGLLHGAPCIWDYAIPIN